MNPDEILGILSADHVAVMVVEHSSEAYGALDELTPSRVGGPQSLLLRKGQEATVKAVVRTQDGEIIEGAELTWSIDEEEENIEVEDGVITALASNHKGGDDFGKYNASKIMFKSPTHLVAGELLVNVSNPVAKVKLSKDSLISLAIGQKAMVTAMALDGDDKPVPNLGAMGNYEWESDSGSAGVDADKHTSGEDKGKFTMPAGAAATITGKKSGDAAISASIEGKSASVDVTVSGSSTLRELVYSDPGTQTFVWNQDQALPEWDGDEIVAAAGINTTGSTTAGLATGAIVEGNVYTSFTVEMIRTRSDTQDTGFAHGDLRITSNVTSDSHGLGAYWTGDAGEVTVYIIAGSYDGATPSVFTPYVYQVTPADLTNTLTSLDGPLSAQPAEGKTVKASEVEVILTLSATGADPEPIRFVIDISKREHSY